MLGRSSLEAGGAARSPQRSTLTMFLFGRKKAAPTPKLVPRGTDQKRSAFRMPVAFDVLYAIEGRRGRRRALAIDLSAGGLRLATDEDLVAGSTLTLDFRLPDEFLAAMVVEVVGDGRDKIRERVEGCFSTRDILRAMF